MYNSAKSLYWYVLLDVPKAKLGGLMLSSVHFHISLCSCSNEKPSANREHTRRHLLWGFACTAGKPQEYPADLSSLAFLILDKRPRH